MDFKLFVQRFFEFVNQSSNFIEIHDYVHMLMKQESITHFEAKVKLIRNLLDGFLGLEGDDDDLVLIAILNLVIQRLVPGEDGPSYGASLVTVMKAEKRTEALEKSLKEWQNVMFEAGVPEFLIGLINDRQTPFLANKALVLLNNLLVHAPEENQARLIALLRQDNNFFDVFYYIQKRMGASRAYLITQIMQLAKLNFANRNISDQGETNKVKPNDFKNLNLFLSQKFDLEHKYTELRASWRESEIYNLLRFLAQLCEGCYEPAQKFLRDQIEETGAEGEQGEDITSIDLIYTVVNVLTDFTDSLGEFVFTAFRAYSVIPAIMDALTEFLYGPCAANQEFLGGNKKFINVMNELLCQKEMGDFSPLHKECRSRLAIMHKCSQVLLAIVDIKDPETAAKTHRVILAEMDIRRLIRLCTDIFINRVGGTPELRHAWAYDLRCTHANEKGSGCIEGEYCAKGHLLPADFDTVATGFNLYQVLQKLQASHPEDEQLAPFKRDENEYLYLLQREQEFLANLNYQHSSRAKLQQAHYDAFDVKSVRVLDEAIAKRFPQTFIAFIEKTASELQDKSSSQRLTELLNAAKKTKSPVDRQQLLEKLRELVREVIPRAAEAAKLAGPSPQKQETQNHSQSALDVSGIGGDEEGEDGAGVEPLLEAATKNDFKAKKIETSWCQRLLVKIGCKTSKMTDLDEQVNPI